jgi:hypothetical protein
MDEKKKLEEPAGLTWFDTILLCLLIIALEASMVYFVIYVTVRW